MTDKKKGFSVHNDKKHSDPITKTEVTLSPDEKAIADLVAADSEDWETISEDDLNDFSLMQNPMDLPPEAAVLQRNKQYAFKWCERTPDRIRQLTRAARRPLRWKLASRTNLPALEHLVDSLLGGVCVLDQILLFKPWHDHVLVQKAKVDMAEITDKSGGLEAKSHQLTDDGIYAQSSIRSMGSSEAPKTPEVGGSDVVMAESGIDDLIAE